MSAATHRRQKSDLVAQCQNRVRPGELGSDSHSRAKEKIGKAGIQRGKCRREMGYCRALGNLGVEDTVTADRNGSRLAIMPEKQDTYNDHD